MYLKSVSIKNFRCFENLEVDFDRKVNLIAGINGSGKSTLLDAIALSLRIFFLRFDNPFVRVKGIEPRDTRVKAVRQGETEDVQFLFPVELTAEADIDGKSIRWQRSKRSQNGVTTFRQAMDLVSISEEYQIRLRNFDTSLILPFLGYYGTGRLWDYHREKKTAKGYVNTRTNGYADSLDGTSNIKFMLKWFRKKTYQNNSTVGLEPSRSVELDTVYSAMAKCFQRLSQSAKRDGSSKSDASILFEYNFDVDELDCVICENGLKTRIQLSQLSDGFRGIISLVADIAYRMAVLNPALGSEILEKTGGVVLIDEID